MEPTSSGQARRRRQHRRKPPPKGSARADTMSLSGRWRRRDRPRLCHASSRQPRFQHWSANVLQRHHAEGTAPTAERTVNPAGASRESLTSNPRVREHPQPGTDIQSPKFEVRLSPNNGRKWVHELESVVDPLQTSVALPHEVCSGLISWAIVAGPRLSAGGGAVPAVPVHPERGHNQQG